MRKRTRGGEYELRKGERIRKGEGREEGEEQEGGRRGEEVRFYCTDPIRLRT